METVKILSAWLYLKSKQKRLNISENFQIKLQSVTNLQRILLDTYQLSLPQTYFTWKKGWVGAEKEQQKTFFLFFFALDILICSLFRSKNHDFLGGNYFAKMYYFNVKSACGVVLPQRKILYVVSEDLVSNRPTFQLLISLALI